MYEIPSASLCEVVLVGKDLRALVWADCKEVLRSCPAGWAALVHTSPPYNIDRPYEGFCDSKDIAGYERFLQEVIPDLSRILKPGGSIFWQTGYTEKHGPGPGNNKGRIVLLDSLSLPVFLECGLVLWDRIVWNYFGSMAFKSKFTNRHETILWLVKPGRDGLGPTFNLDAVREKALSYDSRNHILGRNPGNVWQTDRVAYGSAGQTSHPAVFPEEVSEKIIRCCSKSGDVVVDPFMGSGTACKVSLTMGRQFLGCDISKNYVREADERLGLWASSEEHNLALGLIVLYGFQRKAGVRTVEESAKLLAIACRGGAPREVYQLERIVADLCASSKVTPTAKRQKQQFWKKYDQLMASGDASDPIIASDRALCFCFAHRKRWNGVKRWLSAGLLLNAP